MTETTISAQGALATPVEAINHPPHYTSHGSGIEAIDVCAHMGFNLGNAFKYVWRAGLKGDARQDLEKALWYARRERDLPCSQANAIRRPAGLLQRVLQVGRYDTPLRASAFLAILEADGHPYNPHAHARAVTAIQTLIDAL